MAFILILKIFATKVVPFAQAFSSCTRTISLYHPIIIVSENRLVRALCTRGEAANYCKKPGTVNCKLKYDAFFAFNANCSICTFRGTGQHFNAAGSNTECTRAPEKGIDIFIRVLVR